MIYPVCSEDVRAYELIARGQVRRVSLMYATPRARRTGCT